MNTDDILKEVQDKYGEYIEMADNPSAITCRILACLLAKERENSEYHKKRTKQDESITNVLQ